MKRVLKWTGIGCGGLIGLFVIILIIGAIAAQPESETPKLEREIEPTETVAISEAAKHYNAGKELWSRCGSTCDGNERRELLGMAIEEYNIAIELDPKFDDALHSRGLAHYGLEQYEPAIHDYNEVIRLAPQRAEVYLRRGDVYSRKCEPEPALKDYNEVIRLDPLDGFAYPRRAVSYADLGMAVEARQDLSLAAENRWSASTALVSIDTFLHSPSPRRCAPLPVSLMPQAAYGKAAEIMGLIINITFAIELEPENAALYSARAVAHLQMGLYDEATPDVLKAVELGYDPEFFDDAYLDYWAWQRVISTQ